MQVQKIPHISPLCYQDVLLTIAPALLTTNVAADPGLCFYELGLANPNSNLCPDMSFLAHELANPNSMI